MQDESFSEEAFNAGHYNLTDKEKELAGKMPVTLVMNKVDIVTNKKKLRGLQSELEDLCRFEEVFHVSCETGYGIQSLRSYLLENSLLRPWRYDPKMICEKSPVERAEEAMKQAVMEKYFEEMPYQIGIKVTGWIAKLNGELRIDFQLDVRNSIQVGMVLGENGRILKEVRERAT